VPDVGDQCRVVERIELLLDHVVAAGCPDVVTMQEHIVKMFVTSGTSNPLPLPVPVPVTKGPLESTVALIEDRLPGLDLNSPANAPPEDAMLAQLTTGEGWLDTISWRATRSATRPPASAAPRAATISR
jgi:hypothetical protein